MLIIVFSMLTTLMIIVFIVVKIRNLAAFRANAVSIPKFFKRLEANTKSHNFESCQNRKHNEYYKWGSH